MLGFADGLGYTALVIDQGHSDLHLAALGGKRCTR